jgi:hypothetical protein
MQATRIFQMRLGHSYLLAYPVWFRPDPANCPRCDLELETTEHAILRCPERQYARDNFPKDLHLASAWMSPEQLKIIGDFITRTQTGYPPPHPHYHHHQFRPHKLHLLPQPWCYLLYQYSTLGTMALHIWRAILLDCFFRDPFIFIVRTYQFFGFITSCSISLLYVIKPFHISS